jgi:hypothetical protein
MAHLQGGHDQGVGCALGHTDLGACRKEGSMGGRSHAPWSLWQISLHADQFPCARTLEPAGREEAWVRYHNAASSDLTDGARDTTSIEASGGAQ